MAKYRKCILLDKVVNFEFCKECKELCKNLGGKADKENKPNEGIIVNVLRSGAAEHLSDLHR